VHSTSSFESRTTKVSQLQQHQLSKPAASVNIAGDIFQWEQYEYTNSYSFTGRKTTNSFPIREASTFPNGQSTSPNKAYNSIGRNSSNMSNNEMSKLQSPATASTGSKNNDTLSLLENREAYSPDFLSPDNSPYSTNNNTPFQDAVRNNFNAQCQSPSPNKSSNQLTINTSQSQAVHSHLLRLALPVNVDNAEDMNMCDNDDEEMEDTLSELYGHSNAFSPSDGSPPLHVYSQTLKVANSNKSSTGVSQSNTLSPNRRYVSENNVALNGGGQSKMNIHKQKFTDVNSVGKINKSGKYSSNNNAALRVKHRKSSSMSAILLNDNVSSRSPVVSPPTIGYAPNSGMGSKSRISSCSSSDSIDSHLIKHSQRRSSSGAPHSRSNTPMNSPVIEDTPRLARSNSPVNTQHPQKRNTKLGHRNSFSMSAAPTFEASPIVSNPVISNPTNNLRNQLNLVESLMTHGYQIQHSKDLINVHNSSTASHLKDNCEFISNSRSYDFEKQSSPQKSSKAIRHGQLIYVLFVFSPESHSI